ncbi:LppA family lipoprotein [Amycolatopsis sp. lyj-90]|uniref:LppA family lipoprotein n=1 Tax=Amycolatopsis sp. lyj-90 TaxID=2789285 RepID=UPI00397BF830
MKHALRTSNRIAGAVLAVLLTSTACDSGPDYLDNAHSKDGMSTQQQFGELLKRPSSEDAQKTYRQVLADLQTTLADVGLKDWKVGQDARVDSGCNAFRAVDLHDVTTTYTAWGSPNEVAEAGWPKVTQALTDAAGKHGFTKKGLEVNKPTYREFHLLDGFGADLTLSSGSGSTTGTSSMLTLKTGCHLTAEAHARGVPRPNGT